LLPAVIQRVLRERLTLMGKKQAEENLVQAEAKYRFLVEQIPAITYTTAPDVPGKLLYISPQISQLGFSSEEWLADPEWMLNQIHPEDRTLAHSEITRGHQSGEPLRFEFRLITRAGKVRWFLNEARLIRHESGEPLTVMK
jgi:PAS domain S-box-containing protein